MQEDDLIAYLTEVLEPAEPLTSASELFSSGLLDSVLMVGLIMHVEEKCGIQVRPEDVTLENFDSPEKIVKYLETV